jgi:hypothetical protein
MYTYESTEFSTSSYRQVDYAVTTLVVFCFFNKGKSQRTTKLIQPVTIDVMRNESYNKAKFVLLV